MPPKQYSPPTSDRSEAKGQIGLVRGPGLAEADIDFVSAWPASLALRWLGPEMCEVPPRFARMARLFGIRGDLGLVRLTAFGRDTLSTCQGAWLPDPWLPLTWHAARVANQNHIPYVVTVYENLERHPSALLPGIRHAAAQVLRGSQLIHCISERAKRYVLQLERGSAPRVVIVHPGVDLQKFCPEPSTRPVDIHRFLFVGRLVPEKGVHELLASFAYLRSRTQGAELWVVGSGALQPQIEAATKRVDGMRYLGFISRAHLPKVLRSCHTLILPSKSRRAGPFTLWEEQFGFVVVEAMASGLDIIASRSGSIPEVVGEIGALLSGKSPVVELIDAMEKSVAKHSRWTAASVASNAYAHRHFDAHSNSQTLWSAIERALALQ